MFHQSSYNTSGMADTRAKQLRDFAAWQFATIQDRFENASGFLR